MYEIFRRHHTDCIISSGKISITLSYMRTILLNVNKHINTVN